VDDPLLDIAKGLRARQRWKAEYFAGSKAIIQTWISIQGLSIEALGIPTNMFTVMFIL
jgi:citrate synthase